jgi:hypothetical protein
MIRQGPDGFVEPNRFMHVFAKILFDVAFIYKIKYIISLETLLKALSHAIEISHCSLPLRRVHGIKRMYLVSRTHGLFIT